MYQMASNHHLWCYLTAGRIMIACRLLQFKVEAAMAFLTKGYKVRLIISHPPYKREDAIGTGRQLADMVRESAVLGG